MGLQVDHLSSVHEARNLATAAHYGQWVGNTPYTGYLQKVEDILTRHTEADSIARTITWLHGILTTPITLDTIANRFGSYIAGLVSAVSLPEGDWEEAQISRSRKASGCGVTAVAVILAARIVEVEEATKGSLEYYRYRLTHEEFKSSLGHEQELKTLWTRLEEALTR